MSVVTREGEWLAQGHTVREKHARHATPSPCPPPSPPHPSSRCHPCCSLAAPEDPAGSPGASQAGKWITRTQGRVRLPFLEKQGKIGREVTTRPGCGDPCGDTGEAFLPLRKWEPWRAKGRGGQDLTWDAPGIPGSPVPVPPTPGVSAFLARSQLPVWLS